jgi:hypothetical protein
MKQALLTFQGQLRKSSTCQLLFNFEGPRSASADKHAAKRNIAKEASDCYFAVGFGSSRREACDRVFNSGYEYMGV